MDYVVTESTAFYGLVKLTQLRHAVSLSLLAHWVGRGRSGCIDCRLIYRGVVLEGQLLLILE